jgi:hypothetical protein
MSLTDCTLRAWAGHIFWFCEGPLHLDDPRSVRIGDSTECKNPNGGSACLCKAGIYGKLCLVVMVM